MLHLIKFNPIFRYEIKQRTQQESLIRIPFVYDLKYIDDRNLASITIRWYPRNSGDDAYGEYYRVKYRIKDELEWIYTQPPAHYTQLITVNRLYSNETYEFRIEIVGNHMIQSESMFIKMPKYFYL